MKCRIWRGKTTVENSSAYITLLKSVVLPSIKWVDGYRGGILLSKADKESNSIEFTTLTFFNSIDAIKLFAGENYTLAVVPEIATKLLKEYDKVVEIMDVQYSDSELNLL